MPTYIAQFEKPKKSPLKVDGKPTKAALKAAAARSRLVCVPLDPVLICALMAAIATGRRAITPPEPDPDLAATRAHMQRNGWSQRAAAPLLGVPISTLNATLTGHRLNPGLLARIRLLPVRK